VVGGHVVRMVPAEGDACGPDEDIPF